MARADETGGEAYSGASDARLTELLRADTATAYTALRQLRARHLPAVLTYARLCTTSDSAARQLAAQTFTLAARETARGVDPGVPWRHQLLLLTGRLAASWATDEQSAGLDASLLLVLNTAVPGGPVPPMLAPFQSLPSRAQGLVWYGVVEREPPVRTAGLLGLTREDVVHGTGQALQSLAQACLRARLAASDDPRCADFRRLIEESVRPDSPRDSTDLHAHMTHCPHCTTAYEELCALRDTPGTTLAEGLLPWAGAAYGARSVSSSSASGSEGFEGFDAGARSGTWARARSGTWAPSRRLVLASAALGVALVPLLVFLLTQGDAPSRKSESAGAAVGTPASPPPVTVTATVSATPSPSPTSRSPSPSPSPTRSSSPSRTTRPTPAPVRPPSGAYAQVVNVSTGRCLDVAGEFGNGTDVVTAPCGSGRGQRWRVDSARGVLQSSADPDFCLDSRGDVDNGLGVWTCDSVDGDNGDNLRFTVDDDGVISPAIALATAVTPGDGDGDGDGLSLEPLTGGAEQRWRAGAS